VSRSKIKFDLNGSAACIVSAPQRRLSQVLRDDLGLTGTKVGCNAGDCGACTVLLDDRPVCACMTAAQQVAGRSVETVEGLADKQGCSVLTPWCRPMWDMYTGNARSSGSPVAKEPKPK